MDMMKLMDISNKVTPILKDIKHSKEWNNMFISIGGGVLDLEHDKGELFDQMYILFSEDNMKNTAETHRNCGYSLIKSVKNQLISFFSDRDLYSNEREKYINVFINALSTELRVKFPEVYDKVFLKEFREENISNHEKLSKQVNIVSDKIDNLQMNGNDVITGERNNPTSNINITLIESIMVKNSKRIYIDEVEESRNLITAQMTIKKSLFVSITAGILENDSFLNKFILDTDIEIPIVRCLELLDSCRDKFMKKEQDYLYEFESKGAVITGVGGMGKTVSLIFLWQHILKSRNRGVVYIQLNRVNECSNTDNYIMETLSEKLFYNSHLSGYPKNKQIEILHEFFNVNRKSDSRFVILLDGFNEIHPIKRMKIKSQIESLFYYAGVIVIVTTRPDLRFEVSPKLFADCRLNMLENNQISSELREIGANRVTRELKEILGNVLMITLYNQVCNWNKIDGPIGLFKFSDNITSESELLANFIESLLCKNYYEKKHHSDQLLLTYSLKILVPYIGYRMYVENTHRIEDRHHLWTIIDEYRTTILDDSDHFYKKEIQHLLLDFLNEWKEFFDHDFTDNLSNEIINKSILLQPAEDGEYKFWHQNFRDYMAARFICNEINRSMKKNEISNEIMKEWDTNLLRYICEIIKHDEDNISERLNRMLHIVSIRKEYNHIVVINILRICYVINEEIRDLNFENIDFQKISFYGIKCRNVTFKNCIIGWSLFEPYNWNGTINFVKPITNNDRRIIVHKNNRIHYGIDFDQLYILGIDGVISVPKLWSGDLTGTRCLERAMDEVYHSTISICSKYMLISTSKEFIIGDIISRKVLKHFENKTYFSYDNRAYSNKIIKGIFSECTSSAIVLRENRKKSRIPIYETHENSELDYFKIASCLSHDKNMYSYSSGNEIVIERCNSGFSSSLYLGKNEIGLHPMKFSYNNEVLALADESNKRISIVNLIGDLSVNDLSSGNSSDIRMLEFSCCSRFLVLVYENNFIEIFSLCDLKKIYEMNYENQDVVGVALSYNAEQILVMDSNNRVNTIQRNSGKMIFSGIVQNTSFYNAIFDKCKYISSDNNTIIGHLSLHGAQFRD